MSRPNFVKDEHLEYLDDLRESGEINMLEARPYLAGHFKLSPEKSHEILLYWMGTFGDENR